MITFIWGFLIIVGIIYFLLTGNIDGLNNTLLNSSSEGIKLIMDLLPIIVLWTGIMQIAESSKLLEKFANILYPFLNKLFPLVKKDSKSLGYIASNIAANALGLGSVATPFGLKAMEELQKENDKKEVASYPMITFIILNTSGVTIIPTTTIALRMANNSVNPESIIITSILATTLASIAGLLLDYFIRRKHNAI